jgi:hypothetical protein
MFARLARFDIRFRWLIVVFWIAGTVAAVRTLPALSSVTQSSNAQFLAAPFEDSNPSSTAVITRASPGIGDLGGSPGQERRLGDLNPGWARTQTALAVPSLPRNQPLTILA